MMKKNKQAPRPMGTKILTGDGDGHYAKATGPRKSGIKMANAKSDKGGVGAAHVMKGGGSGYHDKKVHQTKMANHEKSAMQGMGSGHKSARNNSPKHNQRTFMQSLVARKSQVIRGY